jgi:hypothetical protein
MKLMFSLHNHLFMFLLLKAAHTLRCSQIDETFFVDYVNINVSTFITKYNVKGRIARLKKLKRKNLAISIFILIKSSRMNKGQIKVKFYLKLVWKTKFNVKIS